MMFFTIYLRPFSACLLVFALCGCAQFSKIIGKGNQIERIDYQGKFVAKAKDGRYQNMFPGFKDYPVTCEEGCYDKRNDLVCDPNKPTSCRYIGEQPSVTSNLGIEVTWLGHASFLIVDSDGKHFLFDPVSKQFDWPVNWAHSLSGGYTRSVPEWLNEDEIERIDAVMYSHLHYDHFNKNDIEVLGNKPFYFVHQDTASYLPSANLTVKEMAWFSRYQLGQTTIHALPAHHFNNRFYVPYVYEDNEKALWGGWMLEHRNTTLFFAGDTGYSPHFKSIADKYGAIDICLMPIASYYHPEYSDWYRYVHTTPEDALVAAKELGCKIMIPWGYGDASWQMGDRSSHSALIRLLNTHEWVVPEQTLLIMDEGDTVKL